MRSTRETKKFFVPAAQKAVGPENQTLPKVQYYILSNYYSTFSSLMLVVGQLVAGVALVAKETTEVPLIVVYPCIG